ncbi:MAG: fibrobacter succinogenes major paralogous domain-containing protein [Bacteroidetes bacterium]|nr:fibrobacter succinogenes major paralogous domain-containing protein [Bacteroidota bacterium]
MKAKYIFLFFLGVSLSLTLSAQEKIERTFKWTYDGNLFTQTFTFKQSDYEYYRRLKKNNPYTEYVEDHTGHRYLQKLAEDIDKYANVSGYTGHKLAEYLTAFVQQSTPYKTDPDMSAYGGGDYCKHPIETLVENGGDCEDKAFLLVALLKTFGFDAVLINLPEHIAVGFACNDCNGTYYNRNGKKYYFIETTSMWAIGDEPQRYKSVTGKLEEVPFLTRYERKELSGEERRLYANSIEKVGNQWQQNGGTINIINGCYCNSNTAYSITTFNGKTVININGVSTEYEIPANSSIEIRGNEIFVNGTSFSQNSNSTISSYVDPNTPVVINGVKWAPCNVDTPGTFAASPESAGKFYQWNCRKAWAATGYVSGWDSSTSSGTTWEKANDPCPAGWRVPTRTELQSLVSTTYTWTTKNGVPGREFGSGRNSLFIPAAGYRLFNTGELRATGVFGAYWSSTPHDETLAYDVYFPEGNAVEGRSGRSYGYSVRCVLAE